MTKYYNLIVNDLIKTDYNTKGEDSPFIRNTGYSVFNLTT